MPANHVLLQRITVTSPVSSVTFSGIPQTGYTDLKIVTSVRDTAAVSSTDAPSYTILFNGSSANITQRQLISFQAGGNTSYSNSQMYTLVTGANNTANTFASAEVYIPNYTSSNNKSVSIDVIGEGNTTSLTGISISANQWANSAAITSLQFNAYSSFATGSSFSLYGIANASTTPATAPKADGGDIIKTDGTYWYHAFTSTGSFKPQVNLTADILQVAGGGGGGGNGGGGGAGGLLGFTSQALSSTSTYTCTVGAGGAAGTSSTQGFQGSNSQFGSLTASIGGGDGNTQSSPWTYGTGGSGGGGGSGSSTGRAGTSGQGNSGGNSVISSPFPNGGGGGAGAAGGNGSGSTGGAGGAGATYNTTVGGSAGPYAFINAMGAATGTGQLVSGNYYYAGGGGGCVNSGTGGAGGNGGGATGTGVLTGGAAPAGTPNTGGGGAGGGGSSDSYRGGAGGSGIIIIRYPV